MITIAEDAPLVTVMVLLAVNPRDQAALIEEAKKMAPIFASQPGFVAAALHASADGARIVQYLQWRTSEDHLACMDNLEVAAAGARFMAMLEAGEAQMEVREYAVALTMEAEGD